MVKSKGSFGFSANRAGRRRIEELKSEIAPLAREIYPAVRAIKNGLRARYASYPAGSNPGWDAQLEGLLENYEPGATESAIASLTGDSYGDVEDTMLEWIPYGMGVQGFIDSWHSLQDKVAERRRLEAGQGFFDLFRRG